MAQTGFNAPSYLVQLSYGYCVRIHVPNDLKPLIGKTALKFSLQTGKLGLAKLRARYFIANVQMLFQELREDKRLKELTPEVIDDLIRHYRDRAIKKAQRPINPFNENPDWDDETRKICAEEQRLPRYIEQLRLYKEAVKQCAISGEYDDALDDAENLCKANDVHFTKKSDSFCDLCRSILFANVEATEVEIKALSGHFKDLPGFTKRPAAIFPVEQGPVVQTGPTLSAARDEFVKYRDRLTEPWSVKVRDHHLANLNLLIEFLGDVSVDQVGKKDCANFRDMLLKYPVGRNVSKQYRDKTIDQLMKMNIEKTISVGSINNRMSWLKVFFDYAGEHEYHKGPNPAELKRLEDPRGSNEKRAGYTTDELKLLFKSTEYKQDTFDQSYQFWTPIIALFHGMRVNEIAQLYLDDVRKTDDETWVFSIIPDTEDKSAKNRPSRRLVPIHPFVLNDLNLIGYCEKLRAKGEKRLFPELPYNQDGYGWQVSKWFNGSYKKACGIVPPKDGPLKDFHSFRKTFITRAIRLKVPREMCLYVTGHAMGKDEQAKTYFEGFEPKALLDDVISKIDFDKMFNLSHLKKSKFVVK